MGGDYRSLTDSHYTVIQQNTLSQEPYNRKIMALYEASAAITAPGSRHIFAELFKIPLSL